MNIQPEKCPKCGLKSLYRGEATHGSNTFRVNAGICRLDVSFHVCIDCGYVEPRSNARALKEEVISIMAELVDREIRREPREFQLPLQTVANEISIRRLDSVRSPSNPGVYSSYLEAIFPDFLEEYNPPVGYQVSLIDGRRNAIAITKNSEMT